MLMARLRRAMPDVCDRLRVIGRLEREAYLELVAAADVVLDTLHYGGGANTVLDAVAAGAPIISLPGEFHRGRWTHAVYASIGLGDLVPQSNEEYIAFAVRMATDSEWRNDARRRIVAAALSLFECRDAVDEHAEVFERLILG